MSRCVVMALMVPVSWHPPGVPQSSWRVALAEDLVDMLVTLAGVDPAIVATAADRPLADAVAWPGMAVYEVPAPGGAAALTAAAAAGYDRAAVLAADIPDLPGLVVGKLLRPLGSRPVAVAPRIGPGGGVPLGGLAGLAARLPAPGWLPDLDFDLASVSGVLAAAPTAGAAAVAPGWRRMRGPTDLATLDPAVPGWDATRALLAAGQ